jgi:hypothetical protein
MIRSKEKENFKQAGRKPQLFSSQQWNTPNDKIRYDKIVLSNEGPSKRQSHYSDLYYKKNNILIHKCNKQYTNKQFAEILLVHWYIGIKHIYVSDEYSIWKSSLDNNKKQKQKNQTKYISFVDI